MIINCVIIQLSFVHSFIHNFKIYNPHSYNVKKQNQNQKLKKGEEEVGKGCLSNMFRCENGPCIDGDYRCNGIKDCPYDTSDELDCHTNRKSVIPFRTKKKQCTSLKIKSH